MNEWIILSLDKTYVDIKNQTCILELYKKYASPCSFGENYIITHIVFLRPEE